MSALLWRGLLLSLTLVGLLLGVLGVYRLGWNASYRALWARLEREGWLTTPRSTEGSGRTG